MKHARELGKAFIFLVVVCAIVAFVICFLLLRTDDREADKLEENQFDHQSFSAAESNAQPPVVSQSRSTNGVQSDHLSPQVAVSPPSIAYKYVVPQAQKLLRGFRAAISCRQDNDERHDEDA